MKFGHQGQGRDAQGCERAQDAPTSPKTPSRAGNALRQVATPTRKVVTEQSRHAESTAAIGVFMPSPLHSAVTVKQLAHEEEREPCDGMASGTSIASTGAMSEDEEETCETVASDPSFVPAEFDDYKTNNLHVMADDFAMFVEASAEHEGAKQFHALANSSADYGVEGERNSCRGTMQQIAQSISEIEFRLSAWLAVSSSWDWPLSNLERKTWLVSHDLRMLSNDYEASELEPVFAIM